MYSVSNEFKNAMLSPAQEHRLTGTIGSISFDESNIVEGSFQIQNQCTKTDDVVLGSVFVGELTAEITGIDLPYGDWIGKTITPTFALKVGNNWESVPLGIFKVKEANHTAYGVQITAYDNMIKFDKKFNKSHFQFTAIGTYPFIEQICTDCNVRLANTEAEIEAMPNGQRVLEIYGATGKKSEFANDIETYRDLLFWVAQAMGCFATINRAGQLEFRKYTQTVADEINEQHRLTGATFADYVTHYIGIYVDNLDTNTFDYYGYDAEALQQELDECIEEANQILDDMEEVQRKYDAHEITEEEYNVQMKALQKEHKKLLKRMSWLEKALQQADDGASMDLGANPLLCDSNLTTRDAERRAVLKSLDAISYTPFSASCVHGVIYDLGDVIQFSGGLYNSENDSFGCVMSWTYTHNGGTELEGFGVDPAVQLVRTKTQKSVDRANKNAYSSTQSQVGTIDPSDPPTADDSVSGKNGDMYVQETTKTVKKDVSKTYSTWDCRSYIQNNLHWYSYGKIKISSDSGNFVAIAAKTTLGQHTWVVAGSKSRDIVSTYFVVKVPASADVPEITAEISDVTEFNTDDSDKGSGGWGQVTAGTPFYFNPSSAVLNNDGTYKYYLASCAAGSFTGGLRYEVNEPDYIFDSAADMNNALAADQVNIPETYEGSDGNQVYYNDGKGNGDASWQKVKTVTGVSESEDAGGTENNGMTIDTTTQQISLKKNVVRAWYKADPPQIDRNFSQLCVRYTGSPDKQIQIVPNANHVWQNVKVTKDDDHVYKIKCNGSYDSESINYVVYAIGGLVQGKKYYLNFKCNFSDNAKFAYDMSIGCGIVFNDTGALSTGNYSGDEDTFDEANKYYAFRRRPESWYADFGFTATASTMYMCILMQAMTDSSTVSFTLSELVISQKERQLIRNIYLYDYTAKEWLKYKPFTGSVSGGDDGGSVVAIEPTLSSGTKIADFSIDGNPGALYAPDNEYELPIASEETLGGIKVGQNLNIEEDGTLNAEGGSLSELSDVFISSLVNDQTLRYNSVLRKWVNTDAGKNLFIGLTNPSNDVGADNDLYIKRSDYVPPTYSYFKLVMLKNRSNPEYTNLGEITLLKDDDTEIVWSNYNATITTTSAAVNASEGINKVIDGNLSTYYTTRKNPTSESPIEIVITTNTPVDLSEYTKYGWYTAAQLSQRDMVSWEFYISKNGTDWELIDSVSDYAVTTNRSALAYQYDINVESLPLTIDDFFIKINGEWVKALVNGGGGASAIEDLTDVEVDAQTLADGQVLKWDATEEKWVNEDESGGSQAIELTKAQYDALPSAEKTDPNKVYYVTDYPTPSGIDLDDIDDVDLSSPTDGQVLKYDAVNDKWINAAESGSGGGTWGVKTLTFTANPTSVFDHNGIYEVSFGEKIFEKTSISGCTINTVMIFQGMEYVIGGSGYAWWHEMHDFDCKYIAGSYAYERLHLYFTVYSLEQISTSDTFTFTIKMLCCD